MSEWKTYTLPFGMYRGETMYMILINDFDYIRWLDCTQLDEETRKHVNSAIEYYNEHTNIKGK